MEDLINNADVLFQSNASPPLPPAPAGEPVPVLSYGSQHTKVTEIPPPLPPRPQSPPARLAQPASVPPSPNKTLQGSGASSRTAPTSTSTSEDFTPQLPPRPTNSIHPSLRAGPLSGQSRQPSHLSMRNAQFFDDDISYANIVPPPTQSIANASSETTSSPSKRSLRLPPSPLPLASPWSDTQPSMSSAVPFPRAPSSSTPSLTPSDQSPTDIEDPAIQELVVPSKDALGSGPSSGASYASAISPTASVESSAEAAQPPFTPDIPSKPLTPDDSPNRTSVATIGPKSHLKGTSASSE